MDSNRSPASIVLYCDELGIIQKIIKDELGLDGLAPGNALGHFIDPRSRIKLLNFLAQLSVKGTAFEWEINVAKDGEMIPLHLVGALDQDQLMVVFAHTPIMALDILDELMRINNEQVATLRNVYSDRVKSGLHDGLEGSLFEEITHINNELATLQREMVKKISEQEQLNSEILRLNQELDLHLQERNTQLVLMNQLLEEKVNQLEKSERSQRELLTRYRIVAENTYDWEYWLDEKGCFVYISPSCKPISGYDSADFIDNPALLRDVVHPDDLPAWLKHAAMEGNERSAGQIEFRIRQANGEICWIGHACQPVYDEKHNFLGTRGSNRDITDRKLAQENDIKLQKELRVLLEEQNKAQEHIRLLNSQLELRVYERTAQLENAYQELQAFSSSVSHDLRSPLRALQGFSEILIKDFASQLDAQGLAYLNRILESAQKMGELINDLLDLSRISHAEFIAQTIDLGRMAREIAAELEEQNPNRRVVVEIGGDLVALGDNHLLRIALNNLLDNAFKFTSRRANARIEVGCFEQEGDRVYFVRDNGSGFDMAQAEKLFSPFQRLHSARDYPGTGIGLTIVQRVISRHGGRIWFEAKVNHGATFFFTLGKGDAPSQPGSERPGPAD